MGNKIVQLGIVWVVIIVVYVVIAFTMPAFNEIVETANASIAASANMSNFPGTQETVQTSPLWIWFIPGGVGIVYTIVMLKKGEA